jgi:hypothetical protein
MKPVEFDDYFWIVQFGSIADFLRYFLDIKIFRFVPSTLRIIQNYRMGTRSGNISIIRYSGHFTRELLTTGSTEWIVLSVFMGLWEIYNYYTN